MRPFEFVIFFPMMACSGATPSSIDASTDATTSDASVDSPPMDSAIADAPEDHASDAGDASVSCMKPSDCMQGALCCAMWQTGPGTWPMCPVKVETFQTTCTKTCASNFPFTCSAMTTARLCEKKSDCTEQGYGECCTFASDAGPSPAMCVSTFAKPYASGCAN